MRKLFIINIIDNLWNHVVLKSKRIKIADTVIINGRLFVHGTGQITIGNACIINSDENSNCVSGMNHTHLYAVGTITIGSNVGISNAVLCSNNSIVIEDNVLIGSGCKIWDTDFHPIEYEERIKKNEANNKPIWIREGAFIGACSIILKGVTVGKHAVIGAGSVVTKSVPDGEIWCGNPAKFIKTV